MKETRKQRNTQVVITPGKELFIIAKRVSPNLVEVISPFVRNGDGSYNTGFSVPSNRSFRIQAFYELVPKISQYSIQNELATFDCVSQLPKSMFQDVEEGYVHFDVKTEKSDRKSDTITVDPKVLFQNTKIEDAKIEMESKVKFKTKNLKAFPILMNNGFLLSIADKNECVLFLSVLNPSELFVGSCMRREINNIIQHIFPLWSIFNIESNHERTDIYINEQNENIISSITDSDQPLFLQCFYTFNEPNLLNVLKIGENIPIEDLKEDE